MSKKEPCRLVEKPTMICMERKKKTETYLKTANGRERDVRLEGDFAPSRSLRDLRERLQLYDAEIASMIDWIKNEFGGHLHETACRSLETARQNLQKLGKLAAR